MLKVYNMLLDFVNNKYKNPDHPKVFILDGFAGTGKSTIISLFLKLESLSILSLFIIIKLYFNNSSFLLSLEAFSNS